MPVKRFTHGDVLEAWSNDADRSILTIDHPVLLYAFVDVQAALVHPVSTTRAVRCDLHHQNRERRTGPTGLRDILWLANHQIRLDLRIVSDTDDRTGAIDETKPVRRDVRIEQ